MSRNPTRPSRSVSLLGAVVVTIGASHAHATTRTWTNGSSNGDFYQALNWSPTGTPQPSDDLTIGFGNVTASQSPVIDGGGSMVIEGASTVVSFPPLWFLEVGQFGEGRLDVRGGATLNQQNATLIAAEGGSTGAMYVDGTNTVVNLDSLRVGLRGDGLLEITNGGVVNTDNTWIMLNGSQNGSGLARVSGAGSQLNVGTNLAPDKLQLGANGATGTLEVLNGGAVNVTSDAEVGLNGGRGEITVSGTNARLDIAGTLEVARFGAGSLDISGGGVVTAANAGTHSLTFYNVGTSSVDVVGTNSALDIAGDFLVGQGFGISNTGPATVTADDRGEVRVGGTLRLKPQGTLTVNPLGRIKADTLALEGGTLNTQPNSWIEVNDITGLGTNTTLNGNINFGHSGGSADVTLDQGGTFFVLRGFDIAVDAAVDPSFVTVSNGTVVDSGFISIGFLSGAEGNLVVESDGEVRNFDFAGVGHGSGKGEVVVRGTYSTRDMDLGPSFGTPTGQTRARLLVEGDGTAEARGLDVNGDGALALRDNGFFLGETVTINSAGLTDFQGGTFAAEAVVGSLVNHAGTVAPQGFTGGDFQAMTITGDYTQGSAATLDLQLGAAAHDALQITGQADLAGTLLVTLDNLFIPTLGDTFDLLDFGSLAGAFDTVTLPDLSGQGLFWDTSSLFTTGILAVTDTAAPGDLDADGDVDLADIDLLLDNLGDPAFDLTDDASTDYDDVEELLINILDTSPGDANLDGEVSTPDLAILAGSFDQSFSSWADGDFTGDNFVDTADLAVLAGYFGQGTGQLIQGVATPLVPEPASLALLGLGGLLITRRGRSR